MASAKLKILVGITGSIAAYKSALLIRGLVKKGHEVRAIMTPSATAFISPLTISTLTKSKVFTEIFEATEWNNHVELGLWADLMIIAPSTANSISKMANGLCDNMLLAVYLSAKCPVWIAPAMDLDMWQHPSTISNLKKLSSFPNHKVFDVGHGELASGLIGPGRMPEPETIIDAVTDWQQNQNTLANCTAMVTAGPTYEHLDPVRFIGNPSSGKMGIAIANELARRGAKVSLVLGPSNESNIHPAIELIKVRSAQDMFETCQKLHPTSNLSVYAAAVADYTPISYSDQKTKKKDGDWSIQLKRTVDIASTLNAQKSDQQVSIGFALETENAEDNAKSKLKRKGFNFIVLNTLEDKGAGFGGMENKVTIFDDMGRFEKYALKSKSDVARDIVLHYINHYKK